MTIFSAIAQALPISLGTSIAKFLGSTAFFLLKKKRNIAIENISLAFPNMTRDEAKTLARKSFESNGCAMFELFTMNKIVKKLDRHFKIIGAEHFHNARKNGRGVIMLTSHFGSWENLAMLCKLIPCEMLVAVKKLKNPLVDQKIIKLREVSGLLAVHKEKSAKLMVTHLKRLHIVPVLVDQWAGPAGVWNTFFGRETSTTSIPVRIAKKMNAEIIAGYCRRIGPGKFEIELKPPIEFDRTKSVEELEPEVTQKINENLEEQISKYPDQWIWGHRRWKPKPKNIRCYNQNAAS